MNFCDSRVLNRLIHYNSALLRNFERFLIFFVEARLSTSDLFDYMRFFAFGGVDFWMEGVLLLKACSPGRFGFLFDVAYVRFDTFIYFLVTLLFGYCLDNDLTVFAFCFLFVTRFFSALKLLLVIFYRLTTLNLFLQTASLSTLSLFFQIRCLSNFSIVCCLLGVNRSFLSPRCSGLQFFIFMARFSGCLAFLCLLFEKLLMPRASGLDQ